MKASELKTPLIQKNFDDSITVSKGLFEEWRRLEIVSAMSTVVAFIAATLDYEINFAEHRLHSACMQNSSYNEFYRVLCCVFSMLSLCLTSLRQHKKNIWETHIRHTQKKLFDINYINKLQNIETCYEESNYVQVTRYLEILIYLVFPYPYMHLEFHFPQSFQGGVVLICYTVAEFLYVFMFGRIFVLIRAVINFTPYENHLARTYCLKYKVKANFRFYLKCATEEYSTFIALFVLAFPSFLILGALLRIFERPLYDITMLDFGNYFNAVWCTIVAMSTIGFGDFYPSTHFGRSVIVTGALIGGFIFSMIIVTLQKNVILSGNQKKALSSIMFTSSAVEVIQSAFRLHLSKKYNLSNSEKNNRYNKFIDKVKTFKEKLFYSTEANVLENPDTKELKKLILIMHKKIHFVEKKYQEKTRSIEEKLDKLIQIVTNKAFT